MSAPAAGGRILTVTEGGSADDADTGPGYSPLSLDTCGLRDVFNVPCHEAYGVRRIEIAPHGRRPALAVEPFACLDRTLESSLFDSVRRRRNRCWLSFVDRLPGGLRRSKSFGRLDKTLAYGAREP